MRFWSEGLGDSELVMGLDRAEATRKGDVVALNGVIDEPAPWEYEVKIELEDWRTILRIATDGTAIEFIAAHAGWRQIAGMAVSIVKFIALLAFFRLRILIGAGRAPRRAGTVLGRPGATEL